MLPLLAGSVQPGVVNASGWVLTVGGLLVTALWLLYLYR
jgi:hypothetical protein